MVIDFRGADGVPVGTYPAEFVRCDDYDNPDRSDLPPAVRLVWKVTGGDHAGQEASRIASLKFSKLAALPKLLRSIMGRDPQPGEQIDLVQFAGVTGTIVVEETDSGATRVSTFIRTAA